jgi:hypothetical protein
MEAGHWTTGVNQLFALKQIDVKSKVSFMGIQMQLQF